MVHVGLPTALRVLTDKLPRRTLGTDELDLAAIAGEMAGKIESVLK